MSTTPLTNPRETVTVELTLTRREWDEVVNALFNYKAGLVNDSRWGVMDEDLIDHVWNQLDAKGLIPPPEEKS